MTFTRSLALQLAPAGIRVNALAPGTIMTALQAATRPAEGVEGLGVGSTPLHNRPGQPAEMGPGYVFLASSDSNAVTGQVLHMNSGSSSADSKDIVLIAESSGSSYWSVLNGTRWCGLARQMRCRCQCTSMLRNTKRPFTIKHIILVARTQGQCDIICCVPVIMFNFGIRPGIGPFLSLRPHFLLDEASTIASSECLAPQTMMAQLRSGDVMMPHWPFRRPRRA